MNEIAAPNRFATLRLAALYACLLPLIAIARPTPLGLWAGGAFVLAGESIRFWAAGYLVKTEQLITSGPYRHTRNPLYLGRLLILTGLCLMATLPYHANLIVLAVGHAGFFAYYLPRKERVEPTRLRRVHGKTYDHYFENVPPLFPTLTPYTETAPTTWSTKNMAANREHLMVLALLLVTLFLTWRTL